MIAIGDGSYTHVTDAALSLSPAKLKIGGLAELDAAQSERFSLRDCGQSLNENTRAVNHDAGIQSCIPRNIGKGERGLKVNP